MWLRESTMVSRHKFRASHLLVCLILLKVIASSESTQTMTDVNIEATPNSISSLPGFTKDLTLKCSHDHRANSDFGTVLSLIVSKRLSESSAVKDAVFRELASISSFDRYNVNVKNATVGAQVSGQLIANGQSFISLVWPRPNTNISGIYTCDAHGMDRTGHPKVSTATVEITETPINLQMIAGRIEDMDVSQERLKKNLEKSREDFNTYRINTTAELYNTRRDIDMLKENNVKTTALLDNCKVRLDNVRSLMTQMTAQINQNTVNITRLESKMDTCEASCSKNATVPISLGSTISKNCSILEQSYSDFFKFFNACSSYQGHSYFLSQSYQGFDVNIARIHCEHHGSYLAELTDQQEWDFVVNFLKEKNIKLFTCILLGGKMQDKSHNWIYTRSGHPVTFFKWARNKPDYNFDGFNYLYMIFNNELSTMFNYADSFTGGGGNHFLCETKI